MELTQSSFLRTLVAEHRTVVVEFLLDRLTVEFGRDKGTNDTGSSLRTHTDIIASFVFELIHLFGNDVRAVSH